jgi:succinoglycan biosynthesis protein ExoM
MNPEEQAAGAGVYPPLSIGVVTHERAVAFCKLLEHLKPAIVQYAEVCELIVVNNSGASAHEQIVESVRVSGIEDVCAVQVIDSPENSISTGRNLVLDHAREQHLVFVDDDEYPVPTWLAALVDAMNTYACALVTGPIVPVFAAGTPTWITSVDLHNAAGLRTGDALDFAATGNFLMNRSGVESVRFESSYGRSGGEDTEFFLRMKDRGLVLRWCSEAIVHEDIPEAKATARYMIRRFMTQGRNYRTILEQRGEIRSAWLFSIRAGVIFCGSVSLALVLLMIRPGLAGNWIKRGFSNLGKIVNPQRHLYE